MEYIVDIHSFTFLIKSALRTIERYIRTGQKENSGSYDHTGYCNVAYYKVIRSA